MQREHREGEKKRKEEKEKEERERRALREEIEGRGVVRLHSNSCAIAS